VILICMSLVSCAGSKITQENFEKIQTGMTLSQVIAILGEPTESSSLDVAVFSGTVSKWKAGGITISIQFVNHKVVAKQLSKGDK
jgi:outer membrane protein assembly factor BamE (lipoprotein component of BamABCDE complex)